MRILLLLALLPLAWAQFPAVCNTPGSLSTKTCCPDNCGTRGTCVNIAQSVENSWPSSNTIVRLVCDMTPPDIRCQWPIRVFEMVCSCDQGWGGYDCSDCDFGYIANEAGECVKRNTNQLLVRRNFRDLSELDQERYFMVLKEAKTELKQKTEWAVVVDESTSPYTLQNVSTYDLFVVHHFIAAREQGNDKCCENKMDQIDFAHLGCTFATWHRYYLLIVERELRRVAQRIDITNFNIAYWDWTPMESSLFTEKLFGTPEYCSTESAVKGNLFNDNTWPVVSDYHFTNPDATCETVRTLRNIDVDRMRNRSLTRGKISNTNKVCVRDDSPPYLPDANTINLALRADRYADGPDCNFTTDTGFTKRLEGSLELCAGDNQMCYFEAKSSNNLHNAVHRFLGGHMGIVPSASNDPIFFLHHANIDRIFEAWLRKFNGNPPSYILASGGHPGHNRDDYLVPFFPLKTNADMYKISSELGFRYDVLPAVNNDPDIGMCSEESKRTCDKKGTSPNDNRVIKCATDGGGTSSPSTGGGGTSSPSTGGGGTSSPDAGSSDFHVPLHLILISGTSVLMVLKLFIM